MKISMIAFCALILCSIPARGQNPPPREDRQFWSEAQLIKPLTKDKDLIVIGVLRLGRDFQFPVDQRIGAAVAFKLKPYLSLTPTYLYVDQRPFEGSHVREHRLVINLTGRLKAGQFNFTDRNLLERRVRHQSRDFTVYRNRLQIDHPARLGSFKFSPFLADEVFYSTQTGSSGRLGWSRNRVSAGIIKQFNELINAEFFYVYQHDGRARPGNIHAVGALFRFRLK
jgi:hypothetical protein